MGYKFDELKTIHFYETVLTYLKYYLLLNFRKSDNDDFNFLNREIFRINYLQLNVVFSFLMKVLFRYDKEKTLTKEDVKLIFGTVESFIVRRLICKINTTSLNKFFPLIDKDIQQLIEQNPTINYLEAFNYIIYTRKAHTRFPKNEEVEVGIKENDIYNQRKLNLFFILTSVDDIYSKESNLLEKLMNNDVGFSIEHIMPQKLTGKYGDSWKESLGPDWKDIHEKWLNTLPNLTLTAYNSSYSNRDFKSKKTIENGFDESPLKINEFVRKQQNWNEESLAERMKWWIEVVNSIWPEPKYSQSLKVDILEKDIYSLADEVSFTSTKLELGYLFGEEVELHSWSQGFEKVLTILYEEDEEDFEDIIKKEFYLNYITSNKEVLRKPVRILNSNISYEDNTNTDLKIKILRNLLEDLDYDLEEVKFKIITNK